MTNNDHVRNASSNAQRTASTRKIAGRLASWSITLILVIWLVLIYANLPPRPTEVGRRATCLSHVRQIGMAMRMYADEYNDIFPITVPEQQGRRDPLQALGLLCRTDYLDDSRMLMCPSDRRITDDPFDPDGGPATRVTRANCSYSMNVLPGCSLASDPSTPLISDEPGPGGSNSVIHGVWPDKDEGEGQNVYRLGGDAKWFISPENAPDPNIFLENPGVPNDAYIPDTGR